MAAPITHIVLTEKIYPTHFATKDRRKFYIGTSLPDIRYMGVIERDKTHFADLTLKEITSEESFTAGLHFHSYLDGVRENYIVSKNIYSLVPESKYITQAIKFLEDEIYYDKLSNWEEIIGFFDNVIEEELAFGISENDLVQWHNTLQRTFAGKPTAKDLEEFVHNIGRPKQMADEINDLLPVLRKNGAVLDIVRALYDEFESLV